MGRCLVVGELDPTLNGREFGQWQNKTTMTMGEVLKYQKDGDRSRLSGELNLRLGEILVGSGDLAEDLGSSRSSISPGPSHFREKAVNSTTQVISAKTSNTVLAPAILLG